ncbi:hypothetical protein LMG24238_07620 [Paraburkholderia sediminicola]|uniref:Uncharacterized protein n=1 Tax=Paraburkholderia sediminicola TaxID=458836 RepID=A0A6J5CWD1_9BURK|nr:hypothetical protein [Paraburkholderia sediminicola]CAB3745484.1 hypothetical protein LMG24238_07620 [Paraburkholderia sediminicola]
MALSTATGRVLPNAALRGSHCVCLHEAVRGHSLPFDMAANRDLTQLHQLEDELEVDAKEASAGELDGDEVVPDGSEASIYLTTREADLLIKTIRLVLKAHEFSRDARIMKGG